MTETLKTKTITLVARLQEKRFIPEAIIRHHRDELFQMEKRLETGKEVFRSLRKCSMEEFFEKLKSEYDLIDVYWTQKDAFIVKAVFLRKEFVCRNELLDEMDAVEEMCSDGCWNVRVWKNPYFGENGRPEKDVCAYSLNMQYKKFNKTPACRLVLKNGSSIRAVYEGGACCTA